MPAYQIQSYTNKSYDNGNTQRCNPQSADRGSTAHGAAIFALSTRPRRLSKQPNKQSNMIWNLWKSPEKRKYGAIVYEHNPYADHEKSLLFLYVLDQLKNKSVGYIAFTDYDITVCRGCPFGQYNMWSKTNSAKTSFGLNSQSLKEATEYFERIFADERYQFIITKRQSPCQRDIENPSQERRQQWLRYPFAETVSTAAYMEQPCIAPCSTSISLARPIPM